MKVLLRAATIYNPQSKFHLQQQNILIDKGFIAYIGPDEQEADKVIAAEGLCVSAGWVDLHAFVGEPGLEFKEDFETVAAAAAAGGFTGIVCLPNTEPVVQTKGAVNFIRNRSQQLPVTLLPTAAITVDAHGKDLTEMIDLQQAGAVAFTDGTNPLQGADVLLKALQYVQMFDGLLMNRPEHTRLTENGQMHEGEASTRLGLKGIPSLAEEVMVTRDLQLLRYTGGRLHFSLISTAPAIEAIRQAKAEGLQVTCDVASYQAAVTDETIVPFDTNYKVTPPFRSEVDADAIKKGLQDGTIDALVSAHMPQDVEAKKLEFDLADFGIINLETAFAVACTTLALSTEQLVEKFSTNPRRILRLEEPRIEEGQLANLTLFNPSQTWVPTAEESKSKSKNSPFLGQELKGRVLGTIHKGQVVLH
ncbi:dihydroorotase [Pontibacter ummariensis]|uniref:Dihydroorotase n=1 Tax=Pontibacter ummariensis TaxID=1610492 RepID=A0A239F3V8_9BACT|nr:dihydroorotase [Pontibacter ummariensis]PRY12632.1 dihydroorotase [Pontibacter ummariensis]SNS50862.1 dihydroorotase [Pontibacter ummariensis]